MLDQKHTRRGFLKGMAALAGVAALPKELLAAAEALDTPAAEAITRPGIARIDGNTWKMYTFGIACHTEYANAQFRPGGPLRRCLIYEEIRFETGLDPSVEFYDDTVQLLHSRQRPLELIEPDRKYKVMGTAVIHSIDSVKIDRRYVDWPKHWPDELINVEWWVLDSTTFRAELI